MYILKVYSIHYTLRKNKKVQKICVGQNKRYKKYLLFLSRASTHHSFTFNLRFSYELNHMVRLSKTVFGIFNFRLCFNRRSYFCSTKCTDSLNLKHIISFKFEIIEKPHAVSLQDLWLLRCNKKVLKLSNICVSWSSQKTDLETN